MGPKKETKRIALKRENAGKENFVLDDPINSDSWKCVVLMAIEKSFHDCFLIKDFEEEAKTQMRPKIQLISYNGITKLVNEFIKGDIRHKYAFILNFSSVFQEAAEYLTNKSEIPIELQVKLIKVMLLFLKEESLIKIENKGLGPVDPVKAMAERPTTLGIVDNKRKDSVKKGEVGLKVRPPSLTKPETELLKRGEGVKDNYCITDAPINGYFNLYVLLIEFYSPELPLELVKADIPLHGLICVDTSFALKVPETSFTNFESPSHMSNLKADQIEKFWSTFLKLLWNPDTSYNYRNIIFQLYTPRKLLCEKKERREFIYRELSYLMYDMSGYKKQLDEYLANLKLWDVKEKVFDMADTKLVFDDIPNECVTVPVILQSMIDAICGNDCPKEINSLSSSNSDFNSVNGSEYIKTITSSLINKFGSCVVRPDFSNELLSRGDSYLMNIYLKAKALDVYYNLDDMAALQEIISSSKDDNHSICNYNPQNCGSNLREILYASGSELISLRRRYQFQVDVPELDYILYSILMTRVSCPYQIRHPQSPPSHISFKKTSDFELIENIDTQMRKPQFTVTDGSRHVLKSIPCNLKESSKDFFSPSGFKIVSPEKLKASSAPTFRVVSSLKFERSFMSEMLSWPRNKPLQKGIFLNLEEFIKEDVIAKINGFNYLEVLNKSNITSKEIELRSTYNCIDHNYSLLHDAVFVVMHNRIDNQNSQYETFNEVLRTGVGLRDFFNYILQDEADWLKLVEESLSSKNLGSKSFQTHCMLFKDCDFWMVDSIKYQFWKRTTLNGETCETDLSHQSIFDKSPKKEALTEGKQEKKVYAFEGYDISEVIVQFSGIKTVFHSNDCSITSEMIERLYGDQVLGVHVSQAGHTLHLYSYACPEPHIEEPFTFHLTYRNGIIIAFGRRFIEVFDEVEEVVESKTVIKSKKNSSEISTRTIKKKISKMIEDERFQFDMTASLPNGLTIQTVLGMDSCYVRQRILSHPKEAKRLFLPNGNVIKMMTDDTIQIFKVDTSIITAESKEFANNCSKYEMISGDGVQRVVEQGRVTSSKRFQVFQNTDLGTKRQFFRRRDGTNYLLQGDGSLCVKFIDNTKMRVTPFMYEIRKSDNSIKTLNTAIEISLEDYVIVHLEITVEHPDYVTTIYNTQTQKWKLLLPYDSEIFIHPEGEYHVNIDKQTELAVRNNCIKTGRFSVEGELLFYTVVDLSVFDDANRVYVCAKDHTGKKFIIEANSNSYTENVQSEEAESDCQLSHNQWTQTASTSQSKDNEHPDDNASTDQLDKEIQLSHEKRYFVIKKDMSGFELLHEESIVKALTDLKNGSVVFTQTFPESDLRYFVLVTPENKNSIRPWEVKSILPEPKYVPHSSKKMTSSTYGEPPSWMHPFPKRKIKFQVPEYFSCRVFLETIPTGLIPGPNVFDCSYCEIEKVEPKHTVINHAKVEDYLQRLTNNDQDILREMYEIVVAGAINKTRKENLPPPEKLAHYFKMSKYYVAMQEYHKNCIRCQKVPKYFHHPKGMSWLIVNDIVDALQPSCRKKDKFGKYTLEAPPLSARSEDSYSINDIEYNLSIKECQSFSSLSYRSSKSGRTAPGVIETQGVCKCKVKPARISESTPTVEYISEKKSVHDIKSVESEIEEFPPRVCSFCHSDFDLLDTMCFGRDKENSALTLEDLMCLGLV